MSTRCCSHSSPGAVLSLGLGQYLHMWVLINSLLNTGGGSSAILYAARSSPLLSPVSCLHPAGLLVLFLVNRHNRLCLVLLSKPSTGNFQIISWGPLLCFPSFRTHHPSLHDAILKSIVFLLFFYICFCFLFQVGSLVSAISFWMKSKVQTVGSYQVLAALTDAIWGLPSGKKLQK